MSNQQIQEIEETYQNLNVYNPLTIQDNAELLKKLLPKGKLFNIRLPKEKQIKLFGIKSQESFGELVIS